jgi:hypothetical protein
MPLTDINLPEVGRSIHLVGAVYADHNGAFMVLLPGEEPVEAPRSVPLTVDEWQGFLRQTDLVETLCDVEDEHGKMKRAIIRKSNRQVSQNVSWIVFRRDGFKCRNCGCDDRPLTVDHLVTWESGGPSTEENLVACCRKCNAARGETPYADWLMSPYYKRVSAGIDYQGRFANQALIPTLANIPRSPLKEGKKKRRR